MKRLHWILLAMLLPGLALALEKGETLEPWTLQDQFGQARSLDDSTRVLLVARDMDGAKLVKAALAERPKATWRRARCCSWRTSAGCRA